MIATFVPVRIGHNPFPGGRPPRGAKFLAPQLRVDVSYQEITDDGQLLRSSSPLGNVPTTQGARPAIGARIPGRARWRARIAPVVRASRRARTSERISAEQYEKQRAREDSNLRPTA
jgi:hypothetical protein